MDAYKFLASLKSSITRLNSTEEIRITFSDSEKEIVEEYIFPNFPSFSILEEIFEGEEKIFFEVFAGNQKLKRGEIVLVEPKKKNFESSNQLDLQSILTTQSKLNEQILRNQEFLFESKLKSITEISELKFQSLRTSFDELLENQKKIFEMKLDIEREKMESQLESDSSQLVSSTIKEAISDLIPVAKEILLAYAQTKTIKSVPKTL